MDTNKQRQAAKAFAKEWSGKGYEKGETQRFWLSLLHNVFGIDDPTKMMCFMKPQTMRQDNLLGMSYWRISIPSSMYYIKYYAFTRSLSYSVLCIDTI